MTVVITDRQGAIEYVNPFFTELTRYAAEEVIGGSPNLLSSGKHAPEEVPILFKEWIRLIHPDDLDQAWELYCRHEEGELEVFRSERRRRTRSGGHRWSLDMGRIVEREGEGKALRVIGVTIDLEGQKQYEEELHQARTEAEEANQAKSAFLANMSHEIRTPMQAIIGMTELVLDTDLEESQREYLEMVRTSSRALEMLIDDVLDLSRVEAGRLELEKEVEQFVDTVAGFVAGDGE